MSILILISWVISITIGIATGVQSSLVIRVKLNRICLTFGIIYIIFTIVTYAIIIKRIRKSRELFRTSNEIGSVKKEFLVPTILIITYFAFYMIPMAIMDFIPWKGNEVKVFTGYIRHKVLLILPVLGMISDAVVYIFLNKHYRKGIIEKCFKCRLDDSNQGANIVVSHETQVTGL